MGKKVELREWQKRAVDKVSQEFANENRRVLVHATPGGGKTLFAIRSYLGAKKELGLNYIIIVAPSTEIQTSWKLQATAEGINLTTDMNDLSQYSTGEYEGIVTTYQAIHSQAESFRIFTSRNKVYVAVDEAHHASKNNSWGESLKHAVEKAECILMLTGTPWTADGYYIPFVEYDDEGMVKTVFSYSKTEAIKDEVCRVVDFHQVDAGNFEFENGETYENFEEAQKDKKNVYGYAVRKTDVFRRLFEEADIELSFLRKHTRNRAGGLIVAPDIKTAQKFKDAVTMITGGKQIPTIVHSDAENAGKKISEFRKSNDRWLISVNMVSEGVDIKRLQVIVFLSGAKTKLSFIQVVGREERLTMEFLAETSHEREAHFYCLRHPELSKWIEDIEQDQREGVKLLEEKEPTDKERERSTAEFSENDLIAIELFKTDMMTRGEQVGEEVVMLAYELRGSNNHYASLPFYVLCTVAKGMMEEKAETTATSYQDEVPLEDKKESIRKVMNKEISRKLAMSGMIKVHNIHKDANYYVNRKVGIRSTASASLEQLEERLDFIYNTEVSTWNI